MAFELMLEIEDRVALDKVLSALSSCAANPPTEKPNGVLEGWFPVSGMFYYIFRDIRRPVAAEGIGDWEPVDVDWSVGVDILFRDQMRDYDKFRADLRCFIEKLAEISDAKFVLSHQYENVYAVRDGLGIRTRPDF